MRCPFCGDLDSQVKDSRSSEDGAAIRRRRQCEWCGARFNTFERIQLRDLVNRRVHARYFDAGYLAPTRSGAAWVSCPGREGDAQRLAALVSPRSPG